ncbi:hypothetical protein OH76DRAFT_336946 [Lentinus brumalis]|uniref:Uncharacterized protein n=1 Tax=Lentinus brumalis TaxID=2498619 RepID=A0A371CJK1_9APHY|nr:hypothetical protein OH76DRAFT_336946 [Polyporus brumalis]
MEFRRDGSRSSRSSIAGRSRKGLWGASVHRIPGCSACITVQRSVSVLPPAASRTPDPPRTRTYLRPRRVPSPTASSATRGPAWKDTETNNKRERNERRRITEFQNNNMPCSCTGRSPFPVGVVGSSKWTSLPKFTTAASSRAIETVTTHGYAVESRRKKNI